MFKFIVKTQSCSLSFIEAEERQSFGPPTITLQAVLTFENGRSWVLPLPFLLALIEPADDDAATFLDGLRLRFSPKPAIPSLEDVNMEMKPTDDGGYSIRSRTKRE